MRKYILLFLLAALLVVPTALTSQQNQQYLPFNITVKGLAPVLMSQTPQHADIIAIININGTDNAITVLQNVLAEKATPKGKNSEVNLLLSKADMDTVSNLQQTYGSQPKTFLITIRNTNDTNSSALQPVNLESLFR